MATFRYEELKRVAMDVKAEFVSRGWLPVRKIRRKPRDKEKKNLLFTMAINRIDRYRPYRTERGVVLPYFKEK